MENPNGNIVEEETQKWMEGCNEELGDFNGRGVCKKKKIKDTPEGRKLMDSKLAFKLKRNGVCQSGLVALGHTHKSQELTSQTSSLG